MYITKAALQGIEDRLLAWRDLTHKSQALRDAEEDIELLVKELRALRGCLAQVRHETMVWHEADVQHAKDIGDTDLEYVRQVSERFARLYDVIEKALED